MTNEGDIATTTAIIGSFHGKCGIEFNKPLGFIEGDSGIQIIGIALNKLADEIQKLKEGK